MQIVYTGDVSNYCPFKFNPEFQALTPVELPASCV